MTTYRLRVPTARAGSKAQRCVVVSFELLPWATEAMPAEIRLRKALAIVEESIGQARELSRELERRVLVLDRRVISTTPIKENGTLLFWELLDIVHLQAELAASDVHVRGALAIGDVQVRAGFAAGPGLHLTDRLRDEVAVVPRVVVHANAMVEAESNPALCARHHTPMENLGYIKSLLRLDADGVWFVDYLAVHCREAEDAVAFLRGHRQLIERRLEGGDVLDREARAWTWLWSYHNRVVDDLRAEGRIDDGEHRSVRVPATSPLVYTFPADAKVPG